MGWYSGLPYPGGTRLLSVGSECSQVAVKRPMKCLVYARN